LTQLFEVLQELAQVKLEVLILNIGVAVLIVWQTNVVVVEHSEDKAVWHVKSSVERFTFTQLVDELQELVHVKSPVLVLNLGVEVFIVSHKNVVVVEHSEVAAV